MVRAARSKVQVHAVGHNLDKVGLLHRKVSVVSGHSLDKVGLLHGKVSVVSGHSLDKVGLLHRKVSVVSGHSLDTVGFVVSGRAGWTKWTFCTVR